jgi:DNA-binding transcriptional ArsR family regulator
MASDVDIGSVAALIGEPARAAMVSALHDGRSLPAGELARRAGVSASTASGHLARLVDGGILAAERSGRHRYFRLAGGEVAAAWEALAPLAPPRPVRSLREAKVGEALAHARTCYDHLAGKLGVAVADALVARRAIVPAAAGFEPGPQADDVLSRLGVDLDAVERSRRPWARRCVDWSERRPHVAGALGAAIAGRALDAAWVARMNTSRALRITPAGRVAFADLLGVEPAWPGG